MPENMIDIRVTGTIQGKRVTGERETFSVLAERLRPPRNDGAQRLLEGISKGFTKTQRFVFARRGATAEHGPWKPLKQSTIRRRGGTSLVHIDRGRLRRSLTDTSDPDFYSFIRVRPRKGPEIEVGTTVEYSPYVDKRRKLIRVTREDVKRWSGMLAKWWAKNQ